MFILFNFIPTNKDAKFLSTFCWSIFFFCFTLTTGQLRVFFHPYGHIYMGNYCPRVKIGVRVRCYLFSYSFFPYEIKDKTPVSFFSILFPAHPVSCPSWFSFFSQFFTVSYSVMYLSWFFSFSLYFSQSVSVSYFLLLPLFFFTLRFRLSFFLRLLFY
jgi:hypothetical protein